ncbi:zinc-dependent metalloprotease [Corynebacterium heidelbergense]|uniref:Hydrolase n=1 Tax=Corynebacterium heidelbergense TaxID=2055947 RepID=A0A364V3K6_9CORY|nr:zinc-dependent metalloprotease [Corynebacterium heidelbergense]RAV31211.1 hydrolase [Corynebacterium heidelbergense]
MSNFGFGSSSSNDDSDDDRHNNDPNQNPFGFFFGMGPQGSGGGNGGFGGNFGDMLNQFGAMISGFGSDLNNSDGNGAVNYAMSERIARRHIADAKGPKPTDSQAVAEAVRLAELWLDEATALPAGATGSVAFGPEQWLEETLPTWKRLVDPLAENLGKAAMGGVPKEMQEHMGPMAGIMKQANAMNFGVQLGTTLGELAKGVVLSTQWGMPLAQGRTAAIATNHLEEMAKTLGADRRETLIYLACREAAHFRLFQHVPWLAERLILDVEEFAAGLALDNSAMEEASGEFNPEMLNDPESLKGFMERLQGADLSPKVVSSNAHARQRLETSLSLVEGWVDYVVGAALGSRMPNSAMLGAAWSSFRNNGSPMMEALTKTVGISLTAPKANEAAELWRRLEDAVGTERRDAVWNHPDFLPVAEDLDNPAGYIGKIAFDEDEMSTFDPIGEIEKLERDNQQLDAEEQPSAGDENDTNANGDKNNNGDNDNNGEEPGNKN